MVDAPTAVLYIAIAAAVAFLTHRRPAYGVAALVVLAPFDVARYIGPTTITLLKAGFVGLVLAFIVRNGGYGALRTLPVRAVLVSFVFLLAAIALSATSALHLDAVAREAAKTAEYGALFLVATLAFASDPDDRPIWLALQIVTVLVSASALLEYLVGAHSGIFFFGRSLPRLAGALEGPNQLAGWLEIAIPVLFARALLHRDAVLVAVVVIASVTDVLTFSRAGIVALVLAVFVVLGILQAPARNRIRIGLIAAVIILASFAFALRSGLPARYFSLDQAPQVADHLANRGALYRAAIDLWHRSPIVGVGAGNYEFDLGLVGLPEVRTHANSLYLQSLAELGVVGFLATIAQLGTLLVVFGRSGLRRPIVVGAFAACIALSVHQVWDDLFFFTKVGSTFWLVIGVAVAEIAARRLFEERVTTRERAA